jgi:hypothetical protein
VKSEWCHGCDWWEAESGCRCGVVVAGGVGWKNCCALAVSTAAARPSLKVIII